MIACFFLLTDLFNRKVTPVSASLPPKILDLRIEKAESRLTVRSQTRMSKKTHLIRCVDRWWDSNAVASVESVVDDAGAAIGRLLDVFLLDDVIEAPPVVPRAEDGEVKLLLGDGLSA